MKVRLSAQAKADLEQIGDWIARDNPQRAISFIRELRRCCMDLSDFPNRFPAAEGLGDPGLRRRIQGDYLIFYRADVASVSVLRVLHAKSDYGTLI